MQEEVVLIEEYAQQSRTDIRFINALGEFGLIDIIMQQQAPCISSHQLPLLEKYTRLHYELDINMEGIEAISHLLQRVEAMQHELNHVKRKMQLFDAI